MWYLLSVLIRIKKARNEDSRHSLTCIRADGTTVGQKATDFFIQHDLTHYAVETALGLRHAFWGLIASGWTFSDFESRAEGSAKSRAPHTEAHIAEALVGTYDLELTAGRIADSVRIGRVAEVCRAHSVEAIDIAGFLPDIRSRRAELHVRWAKLNPADAMELVFDNGKQLCVTD
jgi:hypothetical protein